LDERKVDSLGNLQNLRLIWISTTTDLSAYVILSEPDELAIVMQSFIYFVQRYHRKTLKRGPFHINNIGYIIATRKRDDYDISKKQ
jgi:hypothetical protein